MNDHAIVSIVLPTYNRAHLIGETIQSVLNQTISQWELFVVDDGSTDKTEEMIKSFRDPRIFYQRIEHCGVIAMVRNKGMTMVKSDLIAFLDSDDLWAPEKLALQLSWLEQYPNAAFTFSNGDQFGEGTTPTPLLPDFFVGNTFLPMMMEEKFIYYVPSFVFRKETLSKLNKLDEHFTSGSENEFFYRMAFYYEGVFSGKSLVKIRKHAQNSSKKLDEVNFDQHLMILKKLNEEQLLTKAQYHYLISQQYYKSGVLLMRAGETSESRGLLIKYAKINPFHLKVWVRIVQSYL